MSPDKTPVVTLCGDAEYGKPFLNLFGKAVPASLVRIPHCLDDFTRIVDAHPHMVITPFPGEDILAAFLRRKEKSQLNPVPLVILQQAADTGAAAALLDLGADAVIDPAAPDLLLLSARLRALLRQYQRYQNLEQTNYDNIRLFKLTKKMHATLNIEELIRMVTEETRELLKVEQVNLLLLDQNPQEEGRLYINSGAPLKRRAVDAIMNDFGNWLRNLELNREISHKVILKYIPRIGPTREAETDELLNIVFTNYLKTKDEFIGIINLLDKDKKELSQGEIALTSALSQQLAFSIKNILLFEALNFLARKDELTQLFNRRYFNERFNDEFLRNKRYGSFFSCIMCDLDHFKEINDTYGHLQGDIVLRSFGNIIREGIRRIDIAARYGGEEFILLLPETTAEDAHQVAERIRINIGKEKFDFPGPVTASFGITCSRNGRIETRLDMIRQADIALYCAKRFGRNRTIIYNESMAVPEEEAPPLTD